MDTSFLQSKRKFVATVIAVGLVATIATTAILGGNATEVGLAIGIGIILSAVVVGTYAIGRRSGHPHSHAVAEAAIAFGVVYLIAMAYRLLTEFGIRSTNEVIAGLGISIVGTFALIGLIVALGRYGPSAA